MVPQRRRVGRGYGHPTQGSPPPPVVPTTAQGAWRRRRLADMRIGDLLDYEGKRYILCGLDPMGVPDRRADLEDAETGETIRVPIALLDGARD